ncbi:polysaccharide pyruvyl transferase family protein [Aequorivita xiaoshiensis]|uniref:Polysaccharide pyruvyl transferase family protein n=1 Tax=Aequorivita xiaoshiensis TaxID=2874476 RepID=A0A9X1QZQ7_9FLAO|nr:polysaccharide pyruvyl transferase family protein [Aequorivita xiaoshiensis]MCG2431661.1 polysaccharide pyruvyl transferase family protein [Aequorivita xiaoshiensis]
MAKQNKIGIFTLPLNNYNYGGILQAYALQKYLESLNCEVEHINRQYNIEPLVKFKSFIYNMLNYSAYRTTKTKHKNFDIFIEKYLKTSRNLYSSNDVLAYLKSEKFNVLLTGSDQVWRRDYASNIYKDLYLDYDYKAKKLSYAASFGKDGLVELDDENEIHKFLMKFTAISVRENSAVELIEKLGIKDVMQHVDPTMLLNKTDYLELVEKSGVQHSNKQEPYVLSYILDSSKTKDIILKDLAHSKKLKVIQNGKGASENLESYISIEEWISRFSNAELIITDSFHGCVFSILFNIPFVALGNQERGLSRFDSLLELFDIKDRLVLGENIQDIKAIASQPMNFEKVNEKLTVERQRAKDYFTQALF